MMVAPSEFAPLAVARSCNHHHAWTLEARNGSCHIRVAVLDPGMAAKLQILNRNLCRKVAVRKPLDVGKGEAKAWKLFTQGDENGLKPRKSGQPKRMRGFLTNRTVATHMWCPFSVKRHSTWGFPCLAARPRTMGAKTDLRPRNGKMSRREAWPSMNNLASVLSRKLRADGRDESTGIG